MIKTPLATYHYSITGRHESIRYMRNTKWKTKEDFLRGAARWLMEELNRKHKIHPKHEASPVQEDAETSKIQNLTEA